jgi:hypothetical protein
MVFVKPGRRRKAPNAPHQGISHLAGNVQTGRGKSRVSAFIFQALETTKILKNFYRKGASNQRFVEPEVRRTRGSRANKDAGSNAFSLPFSPFSPSWFLLFRGYVITPHIVGQV